MQTVESRLRESLVCVKSFVAVLVGGLLISLFFIIWLELNMF
jgi:hypothetical protein